MASTITVLLFSIFLSFLFLCARLSATSHVHIVYLGHNNGQDPLFATESHVQLLSAVLPKEEEAKEAMLYSYRHRFSGFAAVINSTQARTLAGMKGVVSVFRSRALKLHTTRSWDFMGITMGGGEPDPMQTEYGDDVIIGVFDTGVWPESDSFTKDSCVGPIPKTWNGTCVSGDELNPKFNCNNKLIGARYYAKGYERQFGPLNTSGEAEYRSPRDRLGHGTHTASIAVGSAIRDASYLNNLALGTARGGAPRARLAIYKTCWSNQLRGVCTDADIMKAFDDALRDGVHVISASIGSPLPLRRFFSSALDIGSFHAMQVGVTVVFSAGNDGPEAAMVENVTPWSICVGAGAIDRTFPTLVILGNSRLFMGEGFVTKRMPKKELIDGRRLFTDGSCSLDKWNRRRIATGRIVLCFSSVGGVSSTTAALSLLILNASGLIFAEPMTKLTPQDDLLPTVHVSLYQGTHILHYIQSSDNPMVRIFPSETALSRTPAPTVAYFSSRGPSSVYPNILKPDIVAPGVNILAAWSPISPPSLLPPLDTRSVNWNFQSGTSMSCPHVTGIVALLKSAHPDWSPAAIKSALMTTAYTVDTSSDTILARGSLKPVDPFDIGAGHVNPLKALDPGLVYDMDTLDYIHFLCSIGYTQEQIKQISSPSPTINTNCTGQHFDYELNYPAIVVSDLSSTLMIKRTVQNVGSDIGAVYFVNVASPHGVHVTVSPRCLVFFDQGEQLSYYVTITPLKRSQNRYDFGEIVWFDGFHRVRIALVVSVGNIDEDVEDRCQISL